VDEMSPLLTLRRIIAPDNEVEQYRRPARTAWSGPSSRPGSNGRRPMGGRKRNPPKDGGPGVFPSAPTNRHDKAHVDRRQKNRLTIVLFCPETGQQPDWPYAAWPMQPAMLIRRQLVLPVRRCRGTPAGIADGDYQPRIQKSHDRQTTISAEAEPGIAKICAISNGPSPEAPKKAAPSSPAPSRPRSQFRVGGSTGRYRRREFWIVGDHPHATIHDRPCAPLSFLPSCGSPRRPAHATAASVRRVVLFLAHHVFLTSGWREDDREGLGRPSASITVWRHGIGDDHRTVHRRRRATVPFLRTCWCRPSPAGRATGYPYCPCSANITESRVCLGSCQLALL